MSTASFEFAEDLSRFLRPEHRGKRFAYACARAANLKNAIEALGVPHTEVGDVRVNGEPATLQRIVREGDAVDVFAPGARDADEPRRFLADAHLGALARFLRMLGFDTAHDQALADRDIRQLAHDEERIVLTRDRDLLKCRDITRGHFVRALRPDAQLREVAERYRLAAHARPLTLCLHCNLPLAPVAKETIAHRLPARVAEIQHSFTHCAGCDRVYWPGTHYERMRAMLGELMGSDPHFRKSG